ncbi:hypothetical protein MYP_1232 [Sporocytophaga myxococcoides]|uniref:Uncharacterized protein n=1 Tax=Sporocytophaga myxococcoides TaxID=153721 RepID=A0A098LC44_9BACT|nr:hypothetical protein MYP_1232 [Sporocytophaga myxococcoides]
MKTKIRKERTVVQDLLWHLNIDIHVDASPILHTRLKEQITNTTYYKIKFYLLREVLLLSKPYLFFSCKNDLNNYVSDN